MGGPFAVMVPLPEVRNHISGTVLSFSFFCFLARPLVQSQKILGYPPPSDGGDNGGNARGFTMMMAEAQISSMPNSRRTRETLLPPPSLRSFTTFATASTCCLPLVHLRPAPIAIGMGVRAQLPSEERSVRPTGVTTAAMRGS